MEKTNMGRNGKIAQLPKAVREQLNARIDNGEMGQDLITWLNSLPETQALLAAGFAGRPITDENLAHWKRYGYRHWQVRQERLEDAQALLDEAAELGTETDRNRMKCNLSAVLTAEVARALSDLEQIDDPRERLNRLAQLTDIFSRLRREDSHATRLQISRERWQREQERDEPALGPLTPLKCYLMQQAYIAAAVARNPMAHSISPPT